MDDLNDNNDQIYIEETFENVYFGNETLMNENIEFNLFE